MIFVAEPRTLVLVCPAGDRHLVLGWVSRRERLVPVVALHASAHPFVIEDPEMLEASRYVIEGRVVR